MREKSRTLAAALCALVLALATAIGAVAPQTTLADDVTVTEVYRVYNPYSGEHHFTTDSNEYETLVALGWTNEGVAW